MTITIPFRNFVKIRWALQYKPVFPALRRLSKRIRSTRPAWAIHGDPLGQHSEILFQKKRHSKETLEE